MDRIPILWNGTPAGELILEREPLYTCFKAQCYLPEKDLWCVWAIGDQGTQRLGVLEPDQGAFVIRRRLSNQSIRCLGRVLNGEVRLVQERETAWEQVTEPERQIQDPWLWKHVKGRRNVRMRLDGKYLYIAFPYDKGNPFPVTELFCFARIQMIDGRAFAIFSFDDKKRPVFL